MINWKWPTSHCQPIGLDIGSSSVKMIQLAINGEYMRVVAADKVRIDPDLNKDAQARRSFIISSIKRMLAENNFYGKNVVSNLSNDEVRITSLRLAEEHEDKIVQALRKEAAVRFGLEPGKDMVDYIVAGTVQQGDEVKSELIVFAASDEAIRDHIKLLEDAKLKLVSIDSVACALFRSSSRFLRRQEDREQTVVFVDIGSRYTTVVFGRGGEISFVKQIPTGTDKFNKQIASRLGISVNDAEMLRGSLKMEKTGMPSFAEPSDSDVVAKAGDIEKQTGPQYESAQSVNGQTTVALQQKQKTAGLDAATRQTMIDAISGVAEELSHDISLCLRYYTVTFRGKRIERVIITGGGAYEGTVLETFRQELGTEVEIGQCLRGFDMADVQFDGCKNGLFCEWTVAAGLSLKGYTPVACVESGHLPQVGKRAFENEGAYERD